MFAADVHLGHEHKNDKQRTAENMASGKWQRSNYRVSLQGWLFTIANYQAVPG